MYWEAIGASAELAGAAFVFFSLLFVGLQTREATKVARATSDRDLSTMWHNEVFGCWDDEATATLVMRGATDGMVGMTPVERVMFGGQMSRMFNAWVTIRGQRAANMTNMDTDAAIVSVLRSIGGAQWWSASRPYWADVAPVVDELLARDWGDMPAWSDWLIEFSGYQTGASEQR